MTEPSAPDAPSGAKTSDPITLTTPIVRGETSISELVLRKPRAGELRGLSLRDLMGSDIAATIRLIPRISMPPITEAEAENLETEDLASCGAVIFDFFLNADQREALMASLPG